VLGRAGSAAASQTEPGAAPSRRLLSFSELDWGTVGWIGLIHLVALAAPFTFTWQGLVVAAALGWLTGGIGICVGFHRLLTHGSFKTPRPVRWLVSWLGGLAGEGSAIHWVANHRRHHAYSDREGDPHTPLDGAWWAHMLWFLPRQSRLEYERYNRRWAADLVRDPVLVFLDRTFVLWHLALGTGLWLGGYALGGAPMAWSLLVWGMFLRLLVVLHTTWLINSATHMWGYRNYATDDQSRNLWWVALLSHGEGWHNNHHAYPRMARHGHRWWELDTTYLVIRAMRALGLAREVIDSPPARRSPTRVL
jgi:stearoyl-CoA desaturase (delta-9 desaturase)